MSITRKSSPAWDLRVLDSEFLKKKLDTQERFRDKTVAIHNFVDQVEIISVEKENYI